MPVTWLRNSLIDPEEDDCGDADCGEEVWAQRSQRVDSSPILEPTEHVLDFVALSGLRCSITSGRPWPSHTAWSLEFKPIRRGTAPF